MMQTPCACCQQGMQQETDGCDVPRTVTAGQACDSECVGANVPVNMRLAMAEVPVQIYTTGFCPAEALMKGTLFPELVSAYTRGC